MPLNDQAAPIDRTGWQIHCFGRFLIDLPPDAQVLDAYFMHGASINRLEDSPETFARRVDARQRALEHTPHDDNEAALFIRRAAHAEGGTSLISWKARASPDTQVIDTYFAAPKNGHAYYWQTEVTSGHQTTILDTADIIQENLRARDARDAPSAPGFCLNGGFIAGTGIKTEKFEVNILLADHSGTYLTFKSSTHTKAQPPLDELQDFLRSQPARAAALEILHQGRQSIGGMPGQEYLIVNTHSTPRKYVYAWATQGHDNVLRESHLVFEMQTAEHAYPVQGGDRTSPALLPAVRDVLNQVNAIVETIRPHPGEALNAAASAPDPTHLHRP